MSFTVNCVNLSLHQDSCEASHFPCHQRLCIPPLGCWSSKSTRGASDASRSLPELEREPRREQRTRTHYSCDRPGFIAIRVDLAPTSRSDGPMKFEVPVLRKRNLTVLVLRKRNLTVPALRKRNLTVPALQKRNLMKPVLRKRNLTAPVLRKRNLTVLVLRKRNLTVPASRKRQPSPAAGDPASRTQTLARPGRRVP